jgi:Tol biopolymer transport system component/DNA-binding winged helix-turn-helix (wHTH) protein
MSIGVLRPESSGSGRIFRFGAFEFHAEAGELRKHGVRLKLGGQPLSILTMFLERPGEVITREDLEKRLWPVGTYVDYEHSVNAAVKRLRQALGDSADNPRFIETLARRGYRFIAPVNGPASVQPARIPAPNRTERGFPSQKQLWIVLAAVLVLVIGAGILYRTYLEQSRTISDALPPPVPLTSYPGFQSSPSFSPDGTRVAFTWDEPGKHPPSIYVKLIGPTDPVRLTSGEQTDFAPAWSPDGRWIAFLRAEAPFSSKIMVIPSLGGTARELARVQLDTSRFIFYGWRSSSPPFLAWSLDGKWLLGVEQRGVAGLAPERRVGIVRISVEGGEKRPFPVSLDADQNGSKRNPRLSDGEEALTVSPDGKKLAFIHTIDDPNTDIYVVALTDQMMPAGPATSLHFDKNSCHGIAWDADGRSLIVSSDRRGSIELWRVPVSRSVEPSRIDVSDELPLHLAVSKTGQRMAYTHFFNDWNIWRVDLISARVKHAAAFITSTKDEYHPSYSSDGKRIAFESNRFGNTQQIWVSDADGSRAVQLTAFENAWAGSPAWSPNGQQIAFDSDAAGQWDIYVIPSQGGKAIRLTSGSGSKMIPSWSHDGKWIYYCASGDSGPQIWKKAASGGAAIQITKNGGCNQMESPDGRYLYYLNKSNSALWRVPAAAGEEVQLAELGPKAQFTLGKHGIYFLDSMYANTLKFMDYRTGSIKVAGTLPGPMIHGITVSPDERWLLYAKSDSAGSQLRLVEKFH